MHTSTVQFVGNTWELKLYANIEIEHVDFVTAPYVYRWAMQSRAGFVFGRHCFFIQGLQFELRFEAKTIVVYDQKSFLCCGAAQD